MDVTRFETLARAFKVNTRGTSGTLPSLILFENGNETLRFPPIDTKTGVYGKVVDYKEKELMRYFDLDKRYMATRDQGVIKKKAHT